MSRVLRQFANRVANVPTLFTAAPNEERDEGPHSKSTGVTFLATSGESTTSPTRQGQADDVHGLGNKLGLVWINEPQHAGDQAEDAEPCSAAARPILCARRPHADHDAADAKNDVPIAPRIAEQHANRDVGDTRGSPRPNTDPTSDTGAAVAGAEQDKTEPPLSSRTTPGE
jgi:hypothetical protein